MHYRKGYSPAGSAAKNPLRLPMAPSSQLMEPPGNPERFTPFEVAILQRCARLPPAAAAFLGQAPGDG